jgi:catechol 2,3-dioxygenase-like lactoylglutathione lyase family enzyme
MLLYTTIGTDDIPASAAFWAPLMASLGHPPLPDLGEAWLGWGTDGQGGSAFYVGRPFDGGAASAGNGSSLAFPARDAAHVRALHALALRNGGGDEGAPGPRDGYPPDYYVAYARSPEGHKLAFACHGHDPAADGA